VGFQTFIFSCTLDCLVCAVKLFAVRPDFVYKSYSWVWQKLKKYFLESTLPMLTATMICVETGVKEVNKR